MLPPPLLLLLLLTCACWCLPLQEMLDGVPADNFAAAKEDYVMDMVLQCGEVSGPPPAC